MLKSSPAMGEDFHGVIDMRYAALLACLLWPAAGLADELRITRADCKRLVVHEAAPDVAYRPGVDVHGRPVTPADLNGSPQIKLPDEMVIRLDYDVLKGRSGALEGKTTLGSLTLRQGRAYFNNEPLHGWEQEILLDACRKLGVR